jgi:hypothetical protein
MTQDHGRYGREKLSPFERHLAESADKHAFTSLCRPHQVAPPTSSSLRMSLRQ